MSTRKEREQFIAEFCSQFPGRLRAAQLILRHAKTHMRLAEYQCNGHPIMQQCPPKGADLKAWNARCRKLQTEFEEWTEKREAQVEKRLTEICESVGCRVAFGGDPRGYTVRLFLPNGRHNTWGGSEHGYGVPQ